MIQNIKVDIVYYMTAADFEFEFNLGSCCHMRLLNDKAKDKKSYINSLARAVSRSRIIICVGPVFGENGLINTTAVAISRSLKSIDNAAYGIASEGEIKIIDGAVPLVTKEGYFGGCIIESGSQTIILLTENRTIRKAIMKNLIHPYIEDISLMQSASGAQPFGVDNIARSMAQPAKAEEETGETETVADESGTQEQELPPEPLPESKENAATETGSENEEITQETKEAQPANEEEPSEAETETFEESVQTGPEYPTQAENTRTGERKGKGISISILIITVVLLLAVIALCYFVVFLPMQKGISITDYIGQLFNSAAPTASV